MFSVLIYFLFTRNYRVFLLVDASVALVNPFLAQFMLGGFAASGFVSLWAFECIIGAAIYLNRKSAYAWLTAYVVLTIFSAALEEQAREIGLIVPDIVRTIIFAWNGIVIGSLLFMAVQIILQETEDARARADDLLLNILPKEIAKTLKKDRHIIADHFDDVSILFADVVSFTPLSEKMTPTELIELLNELFSRFDAMVERLGLEKIKTIGDCYMVAAGAPRPRSDHAVALAALGLEMRDYVAQHEFLGRRLNIRIGIHSGPVIAGVIGHQKFHYDLWGDTVNTASRMESHGVGGVVQVTEAVYQRIRNGFICEHRGVISVKGKGNMDVWHVLGRQA
jgi:guanylate cyclase